VLAADRELACRVAEASILEACAELPRAWVEGLVAIVLGAIRVAQAYPPGTSLRSGRAPLVVPVPTRLREAFIAEAARRRLSPWSLAYHAMQVFLVECRRQRGEARMSNFWSLGSPSGD